MNTDKNRPHRIVITGGQHSGKTTLLEEIKNVGITTVPESAMILINDLNKQKGVSLQSDWRKNNRADFQLRLARLQLDLEKEVADLNQPVFFDRSLIDIIAYCRVKNIDTPKILDNINLTGRYTHVYLLDLITPFQPRPETGRTSSEEDSKHLSKITKSTYESLGYQVKTIPIMPIKDRLEYILNSI
ncbi:MAG: ATP-binding protein [Armatimonas sp.]